MDMLKAQCESSSRDRVEARTSGEKVELAGWSHGELKMNAFVSPGPLREFARGLLAMADEIDGGEASSERPAEPVKVGDRVVIVAEYPDARRSSSYAGTVGTVTSLDPDDTEYPYLVSVDGEHGAGTWAHSVRRADEDTTDPELAAHIADSAAQDAADAADVDRRHEAARKARELLQASGPFGTTQPNVEGVIRLARWMLGDD